MEPQSVALVPLDEALNRWLAGVDAARPARKPMAEAVGLVLGEPLIVPAPVPARAVARRAGYAVESGLTSGASPYAPVPLATAPAAVAAGDDLPQGSDAVLPADAVTQVGGFAEVAAEVAPGEHARRAGEDLPAGFVLRGAGERLRALDAALAAAAGLGQARVRVPHVAICGEGAALPFVADLLRAHGALLADETQGQAVVILAPGAPPADACCIAPALALQPGEGASLWRRGAVPLLALPSRLDDCIAASLACLSPLLARLTGAAASQGMEARLVRKVASRVGIAEIGLLRRTAGGFEPLATGDLPLAGFAAADAWLLIPPESEGYGAGETVRAHLL